MKDERVLAQKRRVQSDAFQLLIYYLLIALLVQKFIFNANFSQIAVEFIGVILAMFYVEIRNLLLGNDSYSENNKTIKKIIKEGIISGVTSTIIFVILSGVRDIKGILTFVIVMIVSFGGVSLLGYYLNKKKQEKINAELDKKENDIE